MSNDVNKRNVLYIYFISESSAVSIRFLRNTDFRDLKRERERERGEGYIYEGKSR